MATIKGLYIDPCGTKPFFDCIVFGEFEDDLYAYYKLLDCDTIDIVSRDINGIPVSIVCDDNGLLVDNPFPSLFEYLEPGDHTPVETLVGRILICGPSNDEGNLTDLPATVARYLSSAIRAYRDEYGYHFCAQVYNRPKTGV